MLNTSLSKRITRLFISLYLALSLFGIILSSLVLAPPSYAQVASPKLTIQFTCAQAIDHKSGKVCVHTQAQAALTIKVKYCSNYYAVSKSLRGTQLADTHGNHNWSWIPDTKCKGKATAYVTETLNHQSLSAAANFVVK